MSYEYTGMKSLVQLSESTVVQWVLGSSWWTTIPEYVCEQYQEDQGIDTHD